MEFCDCSLLDKLLYAEKNKKPMSMEEIRVYTKQIFNGLWQMHDLGIAHRDLKPENILLKVPGNDTNLTNPVRFYEVDQTTLEVKICDLGTAKVLDKEKNYNSPYVASRYYRAPELILGWQKYDESIDVWATGCILFELITRTPMFPGDSEGLQILEMAQLKGMPTEDEFARLSKLCEIPVAQLLQRNEDCVEVDLAKLMMCNPENPYSQNDIEKAADLI
jgi:serine/threonine protein kinase